MTVGGLILEQYVIVTPGWSLYPMKPFEDDIILLRKFDYEKYCQSWNSWSSSFVWETITLNIILHMPNNRKFHSFVFMLSHHIFHFVFDFDRMILSDGTLHWKDILRITCYQFFLQFVMCILFCNIKLGHISKKLYIKIINLELVPKLATKCLI